MADKEQLKEEITRLKAEIRELKQSESTEQESKHEEMSRREFIKKTGIGAAGLGALAFTGNASALTINSSNGLLLNDTLEMKSNGDLDLKGNRILDASEVKTDDIKNSRTITINGEDVILSHRIITSRLSISEIENSSKINVREGDIYQQIQ